MGIRKHATWGRYIVLKGTSESEMNESGECNEEPQHSHKEPDKGVDKQNSAHECNVDKNESHDLEAHDRGMWVGNMGTEGMWGHVSEGNGKMGVES